MTQPTTCTSQDRFNDEKRRVLSRFEEEKELVLKAVSKAEGERNHKIRALEALLEDKDRRMDELLDEVCTERTHSECRAFFSYIRRSLAFALTSQWHTISQLRHHTHGTTRTAPNAWHHTHGTTRTAPHARHHTHSTTRTAPHARHLNTTTRCCLPHESHQPLPTQSS